MAKKLVEGNIITIEHYRHRNVQHCVVTNFWYVKGLSWRDQYRYAIGATKPNYPVPALYHVSLDPDMLDTMDILGRIIFHGKMIFDSRR